MAQLIKPEPPKAESGPEALITAVHTLQKEVNAFKSAVAVELLLGLWVR